MDTGRAMTVIELRREQYAGTDSIDRAMARAARVLEKFVGRDRGTGALRLYFSNFLSSKETRGAKLTNLPEKFRTSHNILLENLCYFCIETLLDETIPDDGLIAAMIALGDDETFGAAEILKDFPNWPVEFDLHLDPKENWPDIDWIWRTTADS